MQKKVTSFPTSDRLLLCVSQPSECCIFELCVPSVAELASKPHELALRRRIRFQSGSTVKPLFPDFLRLSLTANTDHILHIRMRTS